MEFLDPKLDEYAGAHTSLESELLNKINRETHLEVLQPRMLSGHLQGRFLSMIAKLSRPIRILEVGTYTGYSALCMAEGLSENGKLITIDINEELAPKIQGYLDESPWKNQIELKIGDATQIIPGLNEKFDLVFIDADKENYAVYFDLVINKMNPGGLIMADNVLWSGKVIQEVKPNDTSTKALIAYNEKINADERVENILMPIRDGIMMSRVK
ncbi:O-methyltransferase [Crocinitomicaceae bacterium]|jgi:caffeoyl-CoA O-methyltransferase|nr:O-methyltransferase [Crocinitomicaceae bacterium]MDG2464601.1 O-methyltransferase [Crocinitomicaceae bacterium]